MNEFVTANWTLLLIALAVGLVMLWWLIAASRRTRVTVDRRDTLDEAASPAAAQPGADRRRARGHPAAADGARSGRRGRGGSSRRCARGAGRLPARRSDANQGLGAQTCGDLARVGRDPLRSDRGLER